MKYIHSIALYLSIFTLCSCNTISPANYYIGGYHVITSEAKKDTFRDVLLNIGYRVAFELEYNVSNINNDIPGMSISLRCINNKHVSTPNIELDWTVERSSFRITILQYGSEETDEIKRARKVIEQILDEHKEFHWNMKLHIKLWLDRMLLLYS